MNHEIFSENENKVSASHKTISAFPKKISLLFVRVTTIDSDFFHEQYNYKYGCLISNQKKRKKNVSAFSTHRHSIHIVFILTFAMCAPKDINTGECIQYAHKTITYYITQPEKSYTTRAQRVYITFDSKKKKESDIIPGNFT